MPPQASQTNCSNLPGLYVHFPFCRTKCPYCGFFSTTDLSQVQDFLDALALEMEMYRGVFEHLDSIYIGGGTPSLLSPRQMQKLMGKVRQNFPILPESEITVEVNPGDGGASVFQSLRSSGVNRVIIGVQSFNSQALSFLGRRHTADEAASAIHLAREAGFQNIGIDLIYGIPHQTLSCWLETLDQSLDFAPEHISCYELTLESHTPLAARQAQGDFSLPPEEEQYEFFMATAEKLEQAGYLHYEVSNFARPPKSASRHNQKYWNHTEYLGLGPSGHSFIQTRRWWNTSCLSQYAVKLQRNQNPIQGMEELTLEELRLEALALAFRTKKGLDFTDFIRKYYWDLWKEKRPTLLRLKAEGLLELEEGRAYPTRRGMAVADRLALI